MNRLLLRQLRLPILALILPLFILSSGYLYYRSLMSGILDEALRNETTRADVIIVFGAAIAGGGRPSRVLNSRIKQARKLYAMGMSKRLILTGGIGWGPPAESVVMKRELTRTGVPAGAIHLETRSRSTSEQVAFAVDQCRMRGWKTALLVSDPLHMYRLKLQFRDSGIRVFNSAARSLKPKLSSLRRYLKIEVIKTLAWRFLER